MGCAKRLQDVASGSCHLRSQTQACRVVSLSFEAHPSRCFFRSRGQLAFFLILSVAHGIFVCDRPIIFCVGICNE